MDEKVASYTGGLHVFKSYLKDKWGNLREQGATETLKDLKEKTGSKVDGIKDKAIKNLNKGECDDYSHIYKRKSRMDMVRISAAVMGIEFCYAAETAFVSPTLLQIGVSHRNMTLIWCLSPFIGFFVTPILGSLSDNCRSQLGRRRPFIILLSIGILLGLVLVPNGKAIGVGLGDVYAPTPPTPLQVRGNLARDDIPGVNVSSMDSSFSSSTSRPSSSSSSSSWSSSTTIATLPYGDGEGDESNETRISHRTKGGGGRGREGGGGGGGGGKTDGKDGGKEEEGGEVKESHPWGIFFTIVGTMLLDFDADACQSPSRAYLLDVTVPEDHAVGLSTFTVMAGLGGGLGYAMGGINWDATIIGTLLGGHVRAVFTLVTFIFIACVFSTLYSFREIPLDILQKTSRTELAKGADQEEGGAGYGTMDKPPPRPSTLPIVNGHGLEQGMEAGTYQNYASDEETSFNAQDPMMVEKTDVEGGGAEAAGGAAAPEGGAAAPDGGAAAATAAGEEEAEVPGATLRQYLLSIVYMPRCLRLLCLTNLFCWMSLVCYSLYFTDFVGEAVFGGNPSAPEGSKEKQLYTDGVRFGCWGMALYSLSCSFYSFMIEKLVKRFGARPVYVYGQLVYSVGMLFMAVFRHPAAVIIFSCCAGVMYSTLFTMPYLLVAHYHASGMIKCEDVWIVSKIRQLLAHCLGSTDPKFLAAEGDWAGPEQQVRGLGTDVAIVSSMVFLAQFILSSCMGSIVAAVGSTTAVVCAASILATCGSITATRVSYLDL
ncbi:membrane-associated transporter protein-like isoform X2 [Eriocheir sinensis]|uniref:membrane-associated transporter protein-like isoform X2 n=1 Tax=Eriocheir sinensis TaxID=95602 RepID=UPI0021C817B1|nr:membrane-associated transporter protein-like isoform X2 [Eriocheir sinensis]